MKRHPRLYIIAGPNGAGKTTFALNFLTQEVQCLQFVNADLIAQGLYPLAPEKALLHAGRLMLKQIKEFTRRREDFCFETTLSGKTYAKLLRQMKRSGYQIHLVFLWLPSVETSIQRVADRVRKGGHHIPESIVRRRFYLGIQNLFRLYRPLLDSWTLFDNSDRIPEKIAVEENHHLQIFNTVLFERIQKLV